MPNLTLTFSDSGFPDPFVGTPQQFKVAFITYLSATIPSDNLLFGQIGGTAPADHTLLWLDNGVLKYWNSAIWQPIITQLGNSAHILSFTAATLTADRTVTFQDKDGIVALTSDVFTPRATTILSGATPALDWSTTNSFFISLTVNAVFTSTLSQPGQEIMVAITQPASWTVTWPATFLFPAATPFTQVATGQTDLFVIRNVAGSIYVQQLKNEA